MSVQSEDCRVGRTGDISLSLISVILFSLSMQVIHKVITFQAVLIIPSSTFIMQKREKELKGQLVICIDKVDEVDLSRKSSHTTHPPTTTLTLLCCFSASLHPPVPSPTPLSSQLFLTLKRTTQEKEEEEERIEDTRTVNSKHPSIHRIMKEGYLSCVGH